MGQLSLLVDVVYCDIKLLSHLAHGEEDIDIGLEEVVVVGEKDVRLGMKMDETKGAKDKKKRIRNKTGKKGE